MFYHTEVNNPAGPTGNHRKKRFERDLFTTLFILLLTTNIHLCFAKLLPTDLVTPSQGQTDVGVKWIFGWIQNQGACSYKVQVCRNTSDFNSGPYVGEGKNISQLYWDCYNRDDVILPEETTLYWRVIAYTTCPNSESDANKSSSAIWQFTTRKVPPNPPVLSSPADGANSVTRNQLDLRWNASSKATKYKYQISTSSSFYYARAVELPNQTNIRFVGLAPNTRYYWQVAAGNDAGYSNYSEAREFTTEAHEDEPYDANLAKDYALKYWDGLYRRLDYDSNYNPTYYSYYVGPPNYMSGKDPGACNSPEIACTGDCTNFISQCLKAGGLTLSPPNPNDYIDDKGCLVGVKVLHDWIRNIYNAGLENINYEACQNGNLPTRFKVEVGDIIQFSGDSASNFKHSVIVVEVTDPNSLNGIVCAAHNNDTPDGVLYFYYGPNGAWQYAYFHRMYHEPYGIDDILTITSGPDVITTYPGGNVTYSAYFDDHDLSGTICSEWSWFIRFYHETGSYTAALVWNMSSPIPNHVVWTASLGALPTGYNWQRDENERIRGSVKVVGYDSDEYTHVESKQITCVAPARPGAFPVRTYPADYSTNIPISSTMQWQPVAGATAYRVQISTDPEFWEPEIQVTVAATNHTANLLPDVTYYWRVAAVNDWGLSIYSSVWSFRTTASFPDDVVISNQIISDIDVAVRAHNSIDISATAMLPGGTASFQAGNRIDIRDGVTVEYKNTEFLIDPALR